MPTLQKVLTEGQLISLPDVYIKLQQLLADDDYSLKDIGQVIGYDPAISARLLRMVNSSFFGLASKIDTIDRSITYLGAQQVHDLVLTTSVAQAFSNINNPAFNMQQFWQQSIYCAIAARELSILCNVLDSERLFVIGLLHNIGRLIMVQSIPELTLQATETALQSKQPLHLVEQKVIGFDAATVGAELLTNWNLPASLSEAVKFQQQPLQATTYPLETAILHIAGKLAAAFDQQYSIQEALNLFDQYAVDTTRISTDQLIIVDRMARENLNNVSNLLFPHLQVANG